MCAKQKRRSKQPQTSTKTTQSASVVNRKPTPKDLGIGESDIEEIKERWAEKFRRNAGSAVNALDYSPEFTNGLVWPVEQKIEDVSVEELQRSRFETINNNTPLHRQAADEVRSADAKLRESQRKIAWLREKGFIDGAQTQE